MTHDDQVKEALVAGLDTVDLGVLFDGVDLLFPHFDDGTEKSQCYKCTSKLFKTLMNDL